MKNFAAFPNVVGTHWFQLYDEPSGGRRDGEDYNMGLIDIKNRAYEELTASLSAANQELDAIHRASSFAYVPCEVRQEDEARPAFIKKQTIP